jgi:hypothetical protein
MRTLVALIFLAACATPQTQVSQPAAANTPPPPIRPENAAVASGIVTDSSGRPVASARVSAWAADASCNPIGRPEVHVSGADGRYQLRVASSVGPEFDACIIVEAAAGGSVVRAQQLVHYASDAAGRNVATMNLMLPAAPVLTRTEADRLIQLLQNAMQNHDAVDELKLYIPQGQPALAPIAQYTRGIASVRLLSEGNRRFVYELTGRRAGRTIEVTVWQDALTHIDLPQVQND